MRAMLVFAAGVFCLAAPSVAFAQACTATKRSCSEMYETCKSQCGSAQNPARCVASLCEQSIALCKSSGEWRSARGTGRASCWTTTNKT